MRTCLPDLLYGLFANHDPRKFLTEQRGWASPILRSTRGPHDKYFFRSLRQEIDLYDRKLAYLANYVVIASPADREEAKKKLLAKRALLAETARDLAAEGIEFNLVELPRSFRVAEDASTGH